MHISTWLENAKEVWIWHHCDYILLLLRYGMLGACVGCRGQPIICVERSVSRVRVLRVNKWEALEFFLVQVGYKLLIWGGQLWGVACEKTIKVLSFAPTLPWRGEHRQRHGERERERGGWREDGMSSVVRGEVWRKKRTTNKQTTERKKRNTTKKMATTNQIAHSRDCGFSLVRMWHFSVIIGRYANRHRGGVCRGSEQWQDNGWVQGMSALPYTYLPGIGQQLKNVCVWGWASVCVCVSSTYSFGLEWWLHLLVFQFFPVDVAEEGVFLDVSLALGAAAQTLTWMFGHELEHTERTKLAMQHSEAVYIEMDFFWNRLFFFQNCSKKTTTKKTWGL